MIDTTAIIVAAGQGTRAGAGKPKQYRLLNGEPVLTRTLRAFLTHPGIAHVLVVIGANDEALYRSCLVSLPDTAKLLAPVIGGSTRQESVQAGLKAIMEAPPAIVLVHDGARPFVSHSLISMAIDAAMAHGAAIPGTLITDTIKTIDEQGRIIATPDRTSLRAVQTPQAFTYARLLAAHKRAQLEGNVSFTDDASLIEWMGDKVHIFPGDNNNMKLTTKADFADAEQRLQQMMITRVGTGFDVHAFSEGDHIWLGGVRIAHERGITAHSDGDVVLHALTDAVLGALADGDIGSHFPPSDPQWKGAASDQFLAYAVKLVHERGGVLDHLDATVMCETPKVGQHRNAIRTRIAEITGLPLHAVSIKATTTERLGFTGRAEGIAAQAVATIRLPQQ